MKSFFVNKVKINYLHELAKRLEIKKRYSKNENSMSYNNLLKKLKEVKDSSDLREGKIPRFIEGL